MTEAIDTTKNFDQVRDEIISNPKVFLEDHDVMRALITADRQKQASNVIDLRSIAMDRMEDRLNKLEDTHRTVVAAAYDNVSSMNQIHRVILAVLGIMSSMSLPPLLASKQPAFALKHKQFPQDRDHHCPKSSARASPSWPLVKLMITSHPVAI